MCFDFVVLLICKLHISALPSAIVMKLSSLRSLGPPRFILHSITFREEPLLPLSVGLETVQIRQPLPFLAYLSSFPACDHFFRINLRLMTSNALPTKVSCTNLRMCAMFCSYVNSAESASSTVLAGWALRFVSLHSTLFHSTLRSAYSGGACSGSMTSAYTTWRFRV